MAHGVSILGDGVSIVVLALQPRQKASARCDEAPTKNLVAMFLFAQQAAWVLAFSLPGLPQVTYQDEVSADVSFSSAEFDEADALGDGRRLQNIFSCDENCDVRDGRRLSMPVGRHALTAVTHVPLQPEHCVPLRFVTS